MRGVETVVVRNAYQSERVTSDYTYNENDESTWDRTNKDAKDEVDINSIVAKMRREGIAQARIEFSDEYTSLAPQTLQDALLTVQDAREMFESMPAVVRNRVNNDPVQFLQFVQDPANTDELVQLGLATRREVLPVEPVATPAAAAVPAAAGNPGGQAIGQPLEAPAQAPSPAPGPPVPPVST